MMKRLHCNAQFSARIVARLIERNMTRNQLAKQCNINNTMLYAWMVGTSSLRECEVNAVCELLDMCD